MRRVLTTRAAAQVSSIRHLAYASDVGEAFRPTVPKWVVNGTYAVAFGRVNAAGMRRAAVADARAWRSRSYVAADVAHQTAKAHAAGAAPEEARPSRAQAGARARNPAELNAPAGAARCRANSNLPAACFNLGAFRRHPHQCGLGEESAGVGPRYACAPWPDCCRPRLHPATAAGGPPHRARCAAARVTPPAFPLRLTRQRHAVCSRSRRVRLRQRLAARRRRGGRQEARVMRWTLFAAQR